MNHRRRKIQQTTQRSAGAPLRGVDGEFSEGSGNEGGYPGSGWDGRGQRRGRGARGQRRGPGGPGGPGGRGRGGRRGGGRRPRVSRGDVRIGILAVLNEQPMHGYQIMQEMEDRSGGAWQPSPGSIYPTLQQLADEELVVSQAIDGKNVFSLTESGATAVASNEDPPPWERFGGEGEMAYASLKRSMFQLGAAARQVAAAGSQAQAEAANQIINDARKSIYRLLAEDDVETGRSES